MVTITPAQSNIVVVPSGPSTTPVTSPTMTPSVPLIGKPTANSSPTVSAAQITTKSPSAKPANTPQVNSPGDKPAAPADGGSASALPGGIGGTSGIAVASLFAVAIIAAVLYKSCAVFPGAGGFAISSIFASSDESNGKGGPSTGSEAGFGGNDSPWDQPWQSASELPEVAVREGEAAAALVGGEFAGLLKPGAAKVRPPQVITRLAVPGMCMALSQLTPDSGGSDVASMTSGNSSDGASFRSSRFPAPPPEMLEAAKSEEKNEDDLDGDLPEVGGPKVDLLFVFDTSGSLSWREYRQMKEVLTNPHGLISDVMARAHSGSRVGFVEYAYDSVVVSELDRDQDSVRRRILSSFQGDANNWDKDGMYIYETGEEVGGNALRKVNSLRQQEEETNGDDMSEEDTPTVQAREVPPAMNGMSREAHLALKWSRFEMLPPVANKEIQAKLLNALRLRRVVMVNAGELTKGGSPSEGAEAAIAEKEEMEDLGIRVITLGVGEMCDKSLSKIATGKSHFHAPSVDAVTPLLPKIVNTILKIDPKHDGKLAVNPPPVLKRRKKKREKSSVRKQIAVYRAVKAGTLDPAKSISKGLPRRASDLPPWFTEPPEGSEEIQARDALLAARPRYDSDD